MLQVKHKKLLFRLFGANFCCSYSRCACCCWNGSRRGTGYTARSCGCISFDLRQVFAEWRPPCLLVVCLEFILYLLRGPVQVDHPMRRDVHAGAVHVYFARCVAWLHCGIIYNRSEFIHRFESWYFEHACLEPDPVASYFFAKLLFFLLGICAHRNERFNTLVFMQLLNLLHLRVHAAIQSGRDLLRRRVHKRRVQEGKLQSQVM